MNDLLVGCVVLQIGIGGCRVGSICRDHMGRVWRAYWNGGKLRNGRSLYERRQQSHVIRVYETSCTFPSFVNESSGTEKSAARYPNKPKYHATPSIMSARQQLKIVVRRLNVFA